MIGKRVFLRSLLAEGVHPGTIVNTDPIFTMNRYPLCLVKLDRQEKIVHSVVFYEEEPRVLNHNLFQICWPANKRQFFNVEKNTLRW